MHMDICRKLATDSNVNVVHVFYWTIVFIVINRTFTLLAENGCRECLTVSLMCMMCFSVSMLCHIEKSPIHWRSSCHLFTVMQSKDAIKISR